MSQESYLEIKSMPACTISGQDMNRMAIMNDDADKENQVAIMNYKCKDVPRYNQQTKINKYNYTLEEDLEGNESKLTINKFKGQSSIFGGVNQN